MVRTGQLPGEATPSLPLLDGLQTYKFIVPQSRLSEVQHTRLFLLNFNSTIRMREIVHLQAGQCGNQIGAKVRT